jgi:hypothetical protein
MKPYKIEILKEFKKRDFELISILDSKDEIPWWIEEKWTLKGIKSKSHNNKIIVNFLTSKDWENGTKTVDDIIITDSEMERYSDLSSKIVDLDMRKGNFEEKLIEFWKEFDTKTKNVC